jgi:hypothetical protein
MEDQRTTQPASRRSKVIIALFSLLVIGFGIFARESAVSAQLVQLDPGNSFNILNINLNTKLPQIKRPLEDLLVEGAVTAAVGAGNYFFSQLAYSAAVALTSECPGQKVCWDSKSFTDGFTQAWQGAVGDAIGRFGEAFGVNLCNPSFALQIKLGLLSELRPPPPKCDFNAVANNWRNFANTLTTPQALVQLSAQFSSTNTAPLNSALDGYAKILQVEVGAQRDYTVKKLTDASAGGGFSGINNPVSGRTLSPPDAVKVEFEQQQRNKTAAKQEYSAQAVAGQIASRAVVGVAVNTVRTFVQTIIARLFQRLIQGLLSNEDLIAAQPDIFLNEEGQVQVGSTAEIVSQQFFSPPPKDAGITDPLEQFTVCPGQSRTKDNCVVDNQFATAVRVSEGTPLTVADALKNGLLHGDWPLVSSIDKARDQDAFCYTSAYCESNLKKLRSVRIIPIGWEIAAHKSPVQNPVKLKDVVAKFNDCNSNGVADQAHPYCHLIDPNWLLKAPPAQCRAEVYGQQLLSPDISERAQTCADQPTCLKTDDFGTCIGGWGYCQKEKNIWRFQGDSCPADFNSCRSLTDRVGGKVNYLLNTVDAGVCNADNVGCKAYSLVPNGVNCTLPNGQVASLAAGTRCDVTIGSCTVANGSRFCLLPNGERYDRGTICTTAGGCSSGTVVHSCLVKNGERSCTSSSGLASDASDDWLSAPARYFNANVDACSPNDGGCTSLRPLSSVQSLNLLKNGGFEELEDGDADGTVDHPVGWIPFGKVASGKQGNVVNDSASATTGQVSVILSNDPLTATCSSTLCQQDRGCTCVSGEFACRIPKGQTSCTVTTRLIQDGLPALPKKTYTVSASFKPRGGLPNGKLSLSFVNARGTAIVPTAVQVSTAKSFTAGSDGTCALSGNAIVLQGSSTSAFRASCTFAIDRTDTAHATLEISGTNAFVDDVQYEEGGGTPFHEGYGTAGATMTAKVAPPALGCTGEATDGPECAKFSGVCRENEVGCDKYVPTNGDASVPAITGPQDSCPRECVGYDIYKQEASDFDTEKFPVYFIPTTARSCTKQDVGCSEFTNLDTESREYYSSLRLCQKPDAADSTVFYSWEGSDTVGFQLKVWNLKRTGGAIASGGSDFCAEGCAAGTPAGNAPCTKIDPQTGACVDTSSEGVCTPADVASGDFDCREFYDVDGNRHFRLLSETIIATAECHPYRITTSTQEDCTRGDGKWDDARKECIYNVSAADSNSCGAAANGCRAYNGNAANNVRTAFADQFENGIGTWRDASGQTSGIELSSESVTVGGHSLKIKQRTFFNAATIDVTQIARPGKVYTMSFWARGQGKLVIGFNDGGAVQCTQTTACQAQGGCPCTASDGLVCTIAQGQTSCTIPALNPPTNPPAPKFADLAPATCSVSSCDDQNGCLCTTGTGLQCTVARGQTSCTVPTPVVDLTADWKEYTVGPVAVRDARWGSAQVLLSIGTNGQQDVYVDTLSLKAAQDQFFVVRDSWKTPLSCDRTADGTPSPLEMLGCREYRDSKQNIRDLKSFTTLCREQAVGCQAYSTSQNSVDDPYEKTFNAVCSLAQACPSATSCSCDYRKPNPALPSQPIVLADVCRVRFGQRECRFELDGRYEFSNADPATHLDVVTVPADERKYLVVRPQNLCEASAIGCMVTGQAHLAFDGKCSLGDADGDGKQDVCTPTSGDVCSCTDAKANKTCSVKKGESSCTFTFEDGVVDSWKSVAVKDDPAKYRQTLCTEPELSCEEFTASDSRFYFKDPGDKICSFKETAVIHICQGGVNNGKQCVSQKVCQNPNSFAFGKACQVNADCGVGACDFTDCQGGSCAAVTRSGWFRKSASGVQVACYPELVKDGDFFNIYRNSDKSCSLGSVCSSAGGCPCPATGATACRVAQGNTSCGYDGWVGTCEQRYDRCEEFVDPLDTSGNNVAGQPYYYIVNSKIDLKSCNGSASLKQGCVLFRRTSDTRSLFSAPATYLKSDKDALGGKVSPIDCNANSRDSRCEKRCYGVKNGRCSSDNNPCQKDADCPRFITPSGSSIAQKCDGDTYHGSACSADADCNVAVGEVCDDGSKSGQAASSFTGNDSNVIIKVQPDRACGEWLACEASASVWDNQKNKWSSQCIGFGLCNENEKAGEAFECVNWLTPPKQRLTEQKYVSRDVRYFGQEFSGFSIIDQYPAQYVTPVKALAPGYCVDGNKDVAFPLRTCTLTGDCDFGACVAGKCAGDASRNCAADTDCGKGLTCRNDLTGICAGDPQHEGAPCKPPTNGVAPECGFGYCLDLSTQASVDALRYGIPRNHCANDIKRFCETNVDCPLATTRNPNPPFQNVTAPGACINTCTKDADCPDDGKGHGSCLGDTGAFRCMYDIGGGPLIVTDPEAGASCRGYPEKDSPFDTSVVDQQNAQSVSCPTEPKVCSGTSKVCTQDKDCKNGVRCVGQQKTPPPAGFNCSGGAAAKKSGFGAANVCVVGNDCDCNYRKFSFSNVIRYQGYSKAPSDPRNPGRTYNENGACVGGPFDGRECRPECEQFCRQNGIGPDGLPTNQTPPNGCPVCPYNTCGGVEGGGTCKALSSISFSLGWQGFCLERDRSTNVNGSPNQFACNLWLPIDQLPGAQDIYNQARQAGFQSNQPGPLFYCQVAAGNKNHPGGRATNAVKQPYEVVLHDDAAALTGYCESRNNCDSVNNISDLADRRRTCLAKTNTMASGDDSLTRACAFQSGRCVDRVQTCDPGDQDPALQREDSSCTGVNDSKHEVTGPNACQLAAANAPFADFCGDTTCQPSDDGFNIDDLWFARCQNFGGGNFCNTTDPNAGKRGRVRSIAAGGLNGMGLGTSGPTALFLQELAGIKIEFLNDEFTGSGNGQTAGVLPGSTAPQDVDSNPPYDIPGFSQGPQHYPFMYVYPTDGPTDADPGDPGDLLADTATSVIYANSLRWHDNTSGINHQNHGSQYTQDNETGAIVGEGAHPTIDGGSPGTCAGILTSADPDAFCDRWLDGRIDGVDKDGGDNCIAVGFEFSKTDGHLIRALSGSCHDGGNWGGGNAWSAGVRVTAKLREQCSDLALVYDSNLDPDQKGSAPQTNRLNHTQSTLNDAANAARPAYEFAPVSARCASPGSTANLTPYGRAGLCNDGVTPGSPAVSLASNFTVPSGSTYDKLVDNDQPLPIFESEGGSRFTTVASKAPGSVSSTCTNGDPNDAQPPLARPVYVYDKSCAEGGDGKGYTLGYFRQWYRIQQGTTVGGYPFACVGDCGTVSTATATKNFRNADGASARQNGIENLSKIFARSMGVFTWDQKKSAYVVKKGVCSNNANQACDTNQDCGGTNTCSTAGTTWDQRITLSDRTKIPQVRSADIFTCDASGQCGESAGDGLTVNGTSTGQVFGTNGRLKVAIQYYAHADSNHMPIRQKAVDFGDQPSAADTVITPGFFKNRRGNEIDPASGASRSGCDSSQWGRTPESCEPRYFEEIKTYLCSDSYAKSLPGCGNGYPCQRDNACVFKPRVQIQDNWGICNGTCTTGPDGTNICIDTECRTTGVAARYGTGPWTEFAGEIIVQP